jgi:hypothetical protein
MNIVDSLTFDDSYSSVKLDRVSHEQYGRLFFETYILRELSWNQLNLEKNKIKGNFSNLPISLIIKGLCSEIEELKEEIKDPQNINYSKAFSELGDVAAYLTGLVEWLLEKQKQRL